jgi:hypothetical protein
MRLLCSLSLCTVPIVELDHRSSLRNPMLLTQQCKAELREGGSPYILQEQSKYPRVWRKDTRKKGKIQRR